MLQTISDCTSALDSIRDGPTGHGFGYGDGSFIDWHRRHVVRVFSALCLLPVRFTMERSQLR